MDAGAMRIGLQTTLRDGKEVHQERRR